MTHPLDVDRMEAALKRFGTATGLHATWIPGPEGGKLRIADEAREWTFMLTWRGTTDRAIALQQVRDRLARHTTPGLLATPYVTPELGRTCRDLGLCFLDLAGNAFLKAEGLFVWVAGQRPDKALAKAERPARAFDRTGLRVVFVLLAAPQLLEAPYRDIAKAAGVALGSVARVLADLRDHGFLVDEGRGNRRWIDRPRAIQAWETNFPLRLRDRLKAKRYTARDEGWWEQADLTTFGGCWGGEVAAARMHGDLVPGNLTLYLAGERAPFLAKQRLKADPNGPIEILERFWDLPCEGPLAPPLLVYADLVHLGHPRALEAARRIHEQELA